MLSWEKNQGGVCAVYLIALSNALALRAKKYID
jgi:hypothetical protein